MTHTGCTPGRGELHGAVQPRLYIESELPTRRELAATHTCDMTALLNRGKVTEHPTIMKGPHVQKKQLHEPRDHVIHGLHDVQKEKTVPQKTKERSETTCCGVIRTRLTYVN